MILYIMTLSWVRVELWVELESNSNYNQVEHFLNQIRLIEFEFDFEYLNVEF